MAPHILLGLSLVCRYLYRTATAAGPPAPDAFDAAAGAANALLGWELCKRDSRGFPLILRGSFQVVSIMLFFAAGMTYQTQSPVCENTSPSATTNPPPLTPCLLQGTTSWSRCTTLSPTSAG